MQNKNIKAVLFDLGDTLLSFGDMPVNRLFRQGAISSYEYLKSHAQPVGSFEFYCWQNLIRVQLLRFFSRLTGRDFDMLELLRRIGTSKGIKLSSQQWEHLAWLWYEPLGKTARVEPDIVETLTELKKTGLKLGIVSNTFVNRCCLDKQLEQLHLLDFFPVRLYSYEFGFRKPDARIFKVAAERIGEAFESILFVGDHIRKDVRAAVAMGMRAALIVNSTPAKKKIPRGAWKINRLAELPALVKEISTEAQPVWRRWCLLPNAGS